MQRRHFLTKISLGMSATLMIPDSDIFSNVAQSSSLTPSQQPGKKLGIALVGLGNYATNQLAPALKETKNCYLAGIVTGTQDKVRDWKEKYNIPEKNIYTYENFSTIRDNQDIDIVYVVLPNAMHGEYTIKAANAGKHVICEKPMEVSVQKCQEMIKACKDNNRLLSIGYRLHFEPHHQEMMRLGQKKLFGKVNKITSGHGFKIGGSQWRLDQELAGGGPLMDLGIYSVQGAIYTLGEEPVAVTAKYGEKSDSKKFKEVEESISWQMYFPSGTVAECETSYGKGMNSLKADAQKGWFELSPAFSYSGIKGETSNGKMNIENVNQQARQMDAFAQSVINNQKSIVPGEMGMRDVKILMAIYEAAKTGKKVEVS